MATNKKKVKFKQLKKNKKFNRNKNLFEIIKKKPLKEIIVDESTLEKAIESLSKKQDSDFSETFFQEKREDFFETNDLINILDDSKISLEKVAQEIQRPIIFGQGFKNEEKSESETPNYTGKYKEKEQKNYSLREESLKTPFFRERILVRTQNEEKIQKKPGDFFFELGFRQDNVESLTFERKNFQEEKMSSIDYEERRIQDYKQYKPRKNREE
ncbi:MAG: hypothetical protein KatS3mg001_590 [Candidatus Pacearchaeota archaeon]|nr:MAG: hypothetical protein KatS3mg001_590 [Candidatus Pacearchaeota archaeon]